MSEQSEQNPQNNEFIQLILEVLQVPVKIANQTVDSIIILSLINIVSGAWLAFVTSQNLNSHASLTGVVFLFIASPALILFKLHLTLKEIIGLPDQIVMFFHASSQKVSELNQVKERVKTKLKDANWRVDNLIKEKKWQTSDAILATRNIRHGLSLWNRLSNYFVLARRLRDVQSMISEFEELSILTAGAMLLANPLFLITVTVSIVLTFVWALLALVAFVFYVL